jgi:hypothetical protein
LPERIAQRTKVRIPELPEEIWTGDLPIMEEEH